MRLCADLSHFVVDREFRAPIPPVDQGYIDRILERSDCFQGRIAGREQVQLQINFPQHQEWVEIFRRWWKQGMRSWRQRNHDDATLRFLCELGPPPYAMTDGDCLELSDRWDEALQIKGWVENIWAELAAEEEIVKFIDGMTYEEAKALARELGVKRTGSKQALADKLARMLGERAKVVEAKAPDP